MDKRLKYLSFSVFFVAVICIFIVLILIFTMPDLSTKSRNDQICLPSENGLLFCEATTNSLPKYLNKIISKRYIKSKSEDKKSQQKYLEDNSDYLRTLDKSIWEAKPAAKVTGKEQHKKRKDEGDAGMQPLTNNEWTCGREFRNSDGFLRHGVRYRNGRLVVPVDGTYFIYSMVDFFEPCDTSTGKPTVKYLLKPIKHAIHKFNILDQAETEIISTIQPHQISSNKHYNSYSSYVSTISYLKAGDEVAVKVSIITFLRHTNDNSFGLNLL